MVHKLRETRALVGFSRLSPPNQSISDGKKTLRKGKSDNWLPAVQHNGEGIFFEFDSEKIREWGKSEAVKMRMAPLMKSYEQSKLGQREPGELRPEYVMIHTFAHLLINQLSYSCGYGSSSIRERIYCERVTDELDMFGVLIYTASGDSDGSLGGLVRQGRPGRIENIISDAIKNASWCTSDPICIQSSGQGPESLNLAACYNCTMLPETCCETGNRLLDRGLVCGTLDNPDFGFFSSLKP